MISAALLLAATGHCAEPALCPSPEAIRNAHNRHAQEVIEQHLAHELAHEPDADSVVFHSVRVRPATRLSDIYCGARFDEEARSVNCRFTAHFRGRRRIYTVATLEFRDGIWVVTETLGALREE